MIVCFWLIALMGLILFGALRFVSIDAQIVTAQRSLTEATRLAEKGLALGAHPKIKRGDPLLYGEDGRGGSYATSLSTEESRLNPNMLAQRKQPIILQRLFVNWGMPPAEADVLIGAMFDWVDPDDSLSLNGAEREYYNALGRYGQPFNRPFETLDEMRLVRGMEALDALKPNWQEYFTLWTFGQIDVHTANAEVLAAASGASMGQARRFVAMVSGKDGLHLTNDDLKFPEIETALRQLGIPPKSKVDLALTGSTHRIECIGQFGIYRKKLFLIRNGNRLLMRGEAPLNPERP